MAQVESSRSKSLKVLLLSMPFGPAHSPSIGLTLMKSVSVAQGHSCTIRYANLAFAKKIGASLYYRLGLGYPDNVALTGEWLFSGLTSDRPWRNREEYFEWVVRLANHDARARKASDIREFLQDLTTLTHDVGAFLESEVDLAIAHGADVVGLTSVFQQNMASIAFAKRFRERSPGVPIILGGANAEGAMGRQLLESFPWIDAVVDGEGEDAFREALSQTARGEPLKAWGNLRTRGFDVDQSTAHRPQLTRRAVLGPPLSPLDYADYFDQRSSTLPDTSTIPIHLPFETSRGCWWGAKHHCTFCGLNGATMAFRSREPIAAVDELEELVTKYGRHPIDAVDNILDNNYFRTFLPELAKRKLGLSLFYEIKSNLTRAQLSLLKAAGVDRLQPGIESLSSAVLRIMRKGVTSVQNVMLLKWCKELEIELSWNYLWGFPDEPTEEFARIARLCRLLVHLPAPSGGGPIRLDRFSPNFRDASRIGLTNVRPFESYYYVYHGLPRAAVESVAYFFTFEYAQHPDPESYVGPLAAVLDEWKSAQGEYELVYTVVNDDAVVIDTRPCAVKQVVLLDPLCTLVLTACDRPIRAETLVSSLLQQTRDPLDLRSAIETLLGYGFLIELDGLLVPIASSLAEYRPKPAALARIADAVRTAERQDQSPIVPADADAEQAHSHVA
jgi:ribosomal peptide maturation radical SAM protein 1